jgi:murein DD-endopeptidase MepM/ murein hydrolase activator NlpD
VTGTLLAVVSAVAVVPLTVALPHRSAVPAAAAATRTAGSVPGEAFRWPLAPPHRVVRPFDPPAHRYGRGHRGVDLAARIGTPVRAAGGGVVVYAGPLADRGVVSIRHADGLRTTYEPVTALVHHGDHVVAGQVIGRLAGGHPGCRAATVGADACLHWGAVRVVAGHRTYLDPLALLRLGHLRLLPWKGG